MKTRWEFYFDAWDLRFPQTYNLRGNMNMKYREPIHFEIQIVPDRTRPHLESDETGKIFVTLA
jgi:hypothetical protein